MALRARRSGTILLAHPYQIDYDWSVYEGPNPPCVMLVHHNNVDALKAEEVCLQVAVTHDVGVTITVDNPLPEEGMGVTFTITGTNNILTDPVGAYLDLTLPAGLTYTGNTVSQGSFNAITNQWTDWPATARWQCHYDHRRDRRCWHGELIADHQCDDRGHGRDRHKSGGQHSLGQCRPNATGCSTMGSRRRRLAAVKQLVM